jgi:hypothetical protein
MTRRAGWSIYTEIKLVRDPTLPNHQTPYPTLGELLRKKAEEGVQVLLMVRCRAASAPHLGAQCPVSSAGVQLVFPVLPGCSAQAACRRRPHG